MGKIILHTFDTGNIYGTMNEGTITLNNITDFDRKTICHIRDFNDVNFEMEIGELTPKEKRIILNNHRQFVAIDNGFDWEKMYMADQEDKIGSHFELTKDYVKKHPEGWSNINQDFLIITRDNPGIVAGHPVADCPVVMMSDEKQGVTAVAHCSAAMIDKMLPNMIAKCLVENYNSHIEDIRIFVGACAGNNWEYDSWPKWAKDFNFWKKAIVVENGIFKIDLKKALDIEFKESGFKDVQIKYDMRNTLTDKYHYSNAASRTNPYKYGRQFVGAFYEDENLKKVI